MAKCLPARFSDFIDLLRTVDDPRRGPIVRRRRRIRALLVQTFASARSALVIATFCLWVLSGLTLILWALYSLKSALGIDLMPDRHLADLLTEMLSLFKSLK